MHQTWRFVRALSASGLAMLFAACSNTGSPISITPPGAALAAHGRIAHSATRCCGEFVYVTNFGSHDISADTIEETRGGRLSPVAGQPFAAGTEPWGITIDPTGRFAYVATCASNNVSAFAVDDGSGALTPVTDHPSRPSSARMVSRSTRRATLSTFPMSIPTQYLLTRSMQRAGR